MAEDKKSKASKAETKKADKKAEEKSVQVNRKLL